MPAGQEEAAEGFYSRALGLRRIPKPAHLAARGGAWFRGDGVEVHLGVEDPFVPARKAHPAFLVQSLQELRSRLEREGVEVALDTQIEGHDRFYVSDPFGNRLEMIEAAGSPPG